VEEEESGNAANGETLHEGRIIIDVYLGHAKSAVTLPGDFIKDRRDHFARSTPRRPKINPH
jgi:hypothetical protein